MKLPEFSVKRPVATIMVYCGLFVLSIVALTRLYLDLFPEITFPSLGLVTYYHGASAEEIEEKITKVIESQLSIVSDLKEIYSVSKENFSTVSLRFEWGTDIDAAANDVRDRLGFIKKFLPEDAEDTQVLRFDMNQIPILFLGIIAKESYPNLYHILDKDVADSLKRVGGVGNVMIRGGLYRQINIRVDKERLSAHNLTLTDIMGAIAINNITMPAGTIKTGKTEYLLRVPGEFKSTDEISDIPVGNFRGKVVYLKDVAEIEDGFEEETETIKVDGQTGCMMMVQKRSGANTVEVVDAIKKKLHEIQKKLPEDIKMDILMDSSNDIKRVINNLKTTLFEGGILVIIVILLFLRNFRASLIVLIAIPTSLVLSFLFLYLMGYTINMISLMSMVLAIGMVVDDAIVVLDNIYRHREELKEDKTTSAISGTSEVGLAVTASTLSSVIIFIPIIFVKGITGIIFEQLGMVVSITLLASLFVSLTLSPLMASRFLKIGEEVKSLFLGKVYTSSDEMFKKLELFYRGILEWSLNHRGRVITFFSFVFLGSMLLIPILGTEFFPEEDAGQFQIQIELPVGMKVEETNKTMEKIEKIIANNVPERTMYVRRAGISQRFGGIAGMIAGQKEGPNRGVIMARLIPKEKRKRGIKEINEIIRNKTIGFPEIKKTNFSTGDMMSNVMLGREKPIVIEIYGHSFLETDELAKKISKIIEETPGTSDVSISREFRRPEYQLTIDRQKASALGVSIKSIADALNIAVAGKTASIYRDKGDEYNINVRFRESDRKEIKAIDDVYVRSFNGDLIPLGNLVKVVETLGPLEIERKEQQRIVYIEANVKGRSLGDIAKDIEKNIKKIPLPSGINISFGGSIKEQRETFGYLVIAFFLGVILTYMVMAAQFESFRDPFIIMFSVPFGIVGVIWSLLITGYTLNVPSFIGSIILIGIVVKNAIVFIDYTIQQRKKGVEVNLALLESGRVRLRPILMTSLTTIFGMLPMALSKAQGSESMNPLALAVIGGLTVSMLITLIIVPVIYSLFEK